MTPVKTEDQGLLPVVAPPGSGSGQAPSGGGLIRSLAYMITSGAIIRGGSILFGILIRRILGPQLMGVWNLIEIIVVYLSSATVGVHYSSERLIPYHRALGNRDAEGRIKGQLFSWAIVEGVLLSGGVLVYVVLFGNRYPQNVRTGLYCLPVLFLSHKLLSIYLMLLRSTKKFESFSVANVVSALLDWSLVGWALLWGVEGVFVGAAVTGLGKLAYLHMVGRSLGLLSFRWRLDLGGLRAHLPYAPSYAVFKVIWTVGERLDSLLVGYLLGAGALAYYYLGFQLSRAALDVPIALAYIAFPNLMEKYSLSLSRGGQSFSAEFFRYLRVDLFLILPLILPLGYFGSEFVIRQFLPAFSPGIVAVKITMSAVAVLAIKHLYYQILMANERIDKLILATAVQLPAFLGLFLLVRGVVSDLLTAVAIANFLACGVHLGFALWMTRPMIQRDREGLFRSWVGELFGCLVWVPLLVTVDLVAGGVDGTAAKTLSQLALRAALFWALAMPVAYLGLGPERRKVTSRLLGLTSLARVR